MRKRIIARGSAEEPLPPDPWLDLAALAEVEVTSEDPAFPVEAALAPGHSDGWRASEPGAQLLRILFDEPQHLRQIELTFFEETRARTQQFTVRWRRDGETDFREIVRQQFNFSPPETCRELEAFQVELPAVSVLELAIVPDISRGPAVASLHRLRLAAEPARA